MIYDVQKFSTGQQNYGKASIRAQVSNYFYVFEGYQKHSSFNTSDLEPEDLFLGVGCQWHDQDQNV